jgi:hypothetical protein
MSAAATLPGWLPPRTTLGAPAITPTPSFRASSAASITTGNSLGMFRSPLKITGGVPLVDTMQPRWV